MAGTLFHILFSDIGGVLGTNGWDTDLRRRTVEHFDLAWEEIDKRHQLVFDSFERGFMTLERYVNHVFFHSPRKFSPEDVHKYIYSASVAWPQNIALFEEVKRMNGLKFGLISNEGQGITEHRVSKFGLRNIADFLVISHCVHMRKPDTQIWQLALDLAQAKPHEAIYVDDRELFVQVAAELGISAFQHTSLETTRAQFLNLGLVVPQGAGES